MRNQVLLSALVGAAGVAARDVPSNVRDFYNSLKAKGDCSNKLATGFYAKDNGPGSKPIHCHHPSPQQRYGLPGQPVLTM